MQIKNKFVDIFFTEERKPGISIEMCYDGISFWNRVKIAFYLIKKLNITNSIVFEKENDISDLADAFVYALPDNVTIFNIKRVIPEAIIPTKAHKSDSGYDLYTPINFRLNPGETKRIDTGIIVDIKPGYEIQVRNRSSMVWKYNTMNPIGVGTVDSSYRGSIMIPLYNFGSEQMQFFRGDRIAQMVIKRTENVLIQEGDVNIDTERNNNGFGSSGR